jgi:CheY-like chemotaxis protein
MHCSNIIVVEDDDTIRLLLSAALVSEGYSVVTFKNGKEALEGLASVPGPCLILLDLMMPVMGGLEFLERRLGMEDLIISIPVIIVSAAVDKVTQSKFRNSLQGIIRKPVDLDILFDIVSKYCDGKAA